MNIGVVAATASGRTSAASLRAAWPGEVRVFEDAKASDALREAWRTCDAVVSFLAVGATVRVLAPLLGHKTTDPAVVCVDESMAFAVAVLGGHHGANLLAHRLTGVLGCTPVVTTASDRSNVTPLDSYGTDLGFTVHNPELLAHVGAAMLSGEPVRLEGAEGWPLPSLPPNVSPDAEPGGHRILITDRAEPACMCHEGLFENALVYRPKSLVVGVGSARGVSAEEVGALVDQALESAGLSSESVRCLATADLKAGEPGIVHLAAERGWDLITYSAEALAEIEVPNPSEVVRAEVGTPSVAEAAALYAATQPPAARSPKLRSPEVRPAELRSAEVRAADVRSPEPRPTEPRSPEMRSAELPSSDVQSTDLPSPGSRPDESPAPPTAGRPAELVVEKIKSANATAAVARLAPRGRLSIIGLGPGARDLLTPRAVASLQRASVVVGLDQYVDQVRDLLRPGTRVIESGLGQEEERARTAGEEAARGNAVALVGSGDAGVYAMASPALEFAGPDIDVEGVPGITAAVAASNLLGAPLGHDHAYISLSDLHTPWEVIERRVEAAATGDFTVCFYNPRSRTRDWQLPKAMGILAEHRPPETPVGYVRNATRPDETVTLTTLAAFDPAEVDMFTVVVVGSSRSLSVAGRFVTPRGYKWA